MKAILITASNQQRLAKQWNVEPTDIEDRLPVGYYLVAYFGEETFDTLTAEKVVERWTIARNLENGYVELEEI